MDAKSFINIPSLVLMLRLFIQSHPIQANIKVINTRGREKVGDEIYQTDSYIKSETIRTPSGMKVVKFKFLVFMIKY
jgi:hypothetical protein